MKKDIPVELIGFLKNYNRPKITEKGDILKKIEEAKFKLKKFLIGKVEHSQKPFQISSEALLLDLDLTQIDPPLDITQLDEIVLPFYPNFITREGDMYVVSNSMELKRFLEQHNEKRILDFIKSDSHQMCTRLEIASALNMNLEDLGKKLSELLIVGKLEKISINSLPAEHPKRKAKGNVLYRLPQK